MTDVNQLITEHLDVWTSAIEKKSSAGRGNGGGVSLYGINKLRELIFELAMRGKLVIQDENDLPVDRLLQEVAKERTQVLKDRKSIGKWSKPSKFTTPKRKLPEGWRWVPLADVLNWHVGGGTPSKTRQDYWNGGIPWASVKDVGHEKFLSGTIDQISSEGLKNSSSNLVPKGCLLIITRMGLGRLSINEIDVAINQDIRALSVSTLMSLEYCYLFFKILKMEGAGLTVKGVKVDELLSSAFPLPPVAEQHRIVAKVGELMTLCDALEAQAENSLKAHQTLVETCLVTLTNSQSPEDFTQNWTRIEANFDTLFTTEESIKQLVESIHELAVSGKLVEQFEDEEKNNQNMLRPDKQAEKFDLSAFQEKAEKFELPVGWTIEPLSRVSSNIVDCPHTTPKWTDEGELCIKSAQIFPGRIDFSKPNFVSTATYIERIDRLTPKADDILYKREGGILGVGARIPNGRVICMGQRLMLIRAGDAIRADFLELVINSPWIRRFAKEKTTGGAAPRVNMALVRAYPIPIPPLREQERIVRKVEKLAELCEALLAAIPNANAIKGNLADTLTSKIH